MDSYLFIYIAIVILIAIVSFMLNSARSQENKQRIADYLIYKGATNIIIYEIWFDMDKSNRTYHVEYNNSKGAYCINKCKIKRGFFGDRDVYWKDPP